MMKDNSRKNIDVLARTLFGEAEAGNEADAFAIACVVMNRVALPNWPNDVASVCMQPWQFSCWNHNDPGRGRIMKVALDHSWFQVCHGLASRAIYEGLDDVTHRSTHYYATYVSVPAWVKKGNKRPVYRVGHKNGHAHLFYNDIDTAPPQSAKEALDKIRPLRNTRTAQGAGVASVGIGLSAAQDVLMDVQDKVEPLVPYAQSLQILFLMVALAGIGLTVWARIDDRNRGLR